MKPFSLSSLFALICLLGFPLVLMAQQRDEDSFDSDNKATEVRKPVPGAKLEMFKVPYKIKLKDLEEKKAIQFDDVSGLKSSLYKDALVTGKVESVFITKANDKAILNLGKDSRQCFKVVIDQDDFPKFGSSSPKRIEQLYRNKQIAVSGLLTEHNQLPQIMVSLPHQIEIVEK